MVTKGLFTPEKDWCGSGGCQCKLTQARSTEVVVCFTKYVKAGSSVLMQDLSKSLSSWAMLECRRTSQSSHYLNIPLPSQDTGTLTLEAGLISHDKSYLSLSSFSIGICALAAEWGKKKNRLNQISLDWKQVSSKHGWTSTRRGQYISDSSQSNCSVNVQITYNSSIPASNFLKIH